MNQQSIEKIYPVFIVSSGRSGTTLLRGILNASNQIYIPHESEFIARAYPFYNNKQNFNEDDYQKIVKIFVKTSQNNGWGMAKEYLISYLKERAPQSFADVNSVIYEAYLEQQGLENLQWGIKAPVLIASIERIFEVFPEAKIVHVVRDGRDVSLSYRKIHENNKFQFGPKGIVATALYWIDGLRRVEELHDSSIYELQYENLLSRPEVEVKKLCTFLDIDYDSSMHENYQHSNTNKNLILEKHKQTIHTKIENGIDSTNTKKYLSNMSKFDRFMFELIAVPYLDKYQYSIEFQFLRTKLFMPLRGFAYFGARQFNNWRYHKREIRMYDQIYQSTLQQSGSRVPIIQ